MKHVAIYRGRYITATEIKDGTVRLSDGRTFRSLSGAATQIRRDHGHKGRVSGTRFFGIDDDDRCVCGCSYTAFSPGQTMSDAHHELRSGDPTDLTSFRHARRNSVLGYMRECKQLAWDHHREQCERAYSEARKDCKP